MLPEGFASESTPGSRMKEPLRTESDGKRTFVRELVATLAYNTAIALLLAYLEVKDLRTTFVYAQTIGLSIFLLCQALKSFREPVGRGWLLAIAVPAGAVWGVAVAWLILGVEVGREISDHPKAVVFRFASALIFGALASYYFFTRTLVAEAKARAQEQAIQRMEDARRLAEANLKLLQAQIEPHFLFNTLSNIIQLVDDTPPQARQMLVNLTKYLRASLQRTRSGETSLREELDLVIAYLEIQAVRMGSRLRYSIRVPAELREVVLPPLLLQPLVENAVQHGLEPKPDGGEVEVSANLSGDRLILCVKDTGLGIAEDSPPGVGLTNVRARALAVSGGSGSLEIRPNEPAGVCVQLSLPMCHDGAALRRAGPA